jgi:hypothetical protein
VDVAAWATAVGTLALALVGAGAFHQGRSLIRAATDEATASRDLVSEMRNDRELAYRPVLSVHWPSHVPGTVGVHVPIELTNSGTGPAISCRYVGVVQDQNPLESMSAVVDVPGGQTVTIHADQQLDRNESFALCKWVDESGIGHTLEAMGAIFAKDALDWRYRFIVVKDSRSQPLIERVERWRPGESPEPTWTTCRDLWPDYGVQR